MDSQEARSGHPASLGGVSLTMFLVFVGFSCSQFHGYLFEKRGLDALRIGLLLTAGFSAGVLSPLLQVPIIRYFHGPRRPLLAALAGAALSLALLPLVRGFAPLLVVFAVFSLCNSAIYPLNLACTLDVVRERRGLPGRPLVSGGPLRSGHGLFFRVRGLGTVGFLVGCFVSLFFPHPGELPLLYGGFAAALALAFAVVALDYRHMPVTPGSGAAPRSAPGFFQALSLLREPLTLRLLICLGVMNFANAMATSVQGNYLVHRFHEGQRAISLAWVISTACEVPLMLLCSRIVKTRGLRFVLALGLGGTLFKLLGLAAATQLWEYYLALTLHGFFFSAALTGFGVHLDRAFRRHDGPAVQSLAIVFYQGLPMSLAALAAGWIWHSLSLAAIYRVSAGIALAISGYAFFVLKAMESGASAEPR
jgi:predicted MFS family arabinose efflux permease